MSLFGNYNHVVVAGNMTRDVELRTLATGTKVADVTIAVSESVKRGEKWEEETTFVDVTLWGKTAELCERFGGKGKRVLVAGRLKQEKWVDKASGQNRSKMKVVGESITFFDKGDGDGEREERGYATTPEEAGMHDGRSTSQRVADKRAGREPPPF